MKYASKAPDPVISQLSAAKHLGAVTERFEHIIDNYLEKNPQKVCYRLTIIVGLQG